MKDTLIDCLKASGGSLSLSSAQIIDDADGQHFLVMKDEAKSAIYSVPVRIEPPEEFEKLREALERGRLL